jgi:hypothetical protein
MLDKLCHEDCEGSNCECEERRGAHITLQDDDSGNLKCILVTVITSIAEVPGNVTFWSAEWYTINLQCAVKGFGQS